MIFYLHGLNSSGGSHKAAVFREYLAPIPVLSPTYPVHRADQAVQCLSRELGKSLAEAARDHQPLLLVGSSMGGFYGQYLSRRFSVDHLVMLNPALRPWELLKQVVGWQVNETLGERYYLSAEMVAETHRYAIEEVNDGMPTTLLLDQGDELIDWRIAESIYAGVADIHAYAGGDHAFQHLDEAVKILVGLHRTHAR
ncbi:MAG: YqiA/YcfP family alpha/beta fold hydrolase [Gammaproteobacteria bacterium]|nr:YqiA/YcfP family alpha/beta fold hydrolase [Gammaproteobacteria bacterium]